MYRTTPQAHLKLVSTASSVPSITCLPWSVVEHPNIMEPTEFCAHLHVKTHMSVRMKVLPHHISLAYVIFLYRSTTEHDDTGRVNKRAPHSSLSFCSLCTQTQGFWQNVYTSRIERKPSRQLVQQFLLLPFFKMMCLYVQGTNLKLYHFGFFITDKCAYIYM